MKKKHTRPLEEVTVVHVQSKTKLENGMLYIETARGGE